jgi:hypothetical protein
VEGILEVGNTAYELTFTISMRLALPNLSSIYNVLENLYEK